ncbi:SPFH domain-containing protein, partial [Phenylobacterium sp.]|uniref:SPFH domain-containing protein n=1 Tax=Phenylobacterium sp. TaxID=1871053 RepID=UPI002E37B7F2
MNNRRYTTWAIAAVAVLIVLFNTFYVVEQRQQAIVLRLGEPVRVVNQPGAPNAGLKMKVPFLENVVKLDKRNLSLEAQQEEIIAADQERLVVDAFVRYRI